jgi:ABC-type antimicrobial peptide transport system permease subunit
LEAQPRVKRPAQSETSEEARNLNDPVVLVTVSLVLCVVTMMSATIPANRAASIQPADALRID